MDKANVATVYGLLRGCRIGSVAWEMSLGSVHWAGTSCFKLLGQARGGSRDDHSSGGGCVGCVEESDHERPPGDPSRVRGIEFSKDVFGASTTILRNGKDAYDNGNHTSKGPENGKGLFGCK